MRLLTGIYRCGVTGAEMAQRQLYHQKPTKELVVAHNWSTLHNLQTDQWKANHTSHVLAQMDASKCCVAVFSVSEPSMLERNSLWHRTWWRSQTARYFSLFAGREAAGVLRVGELHPAGKLLKTGSKQIKIALGSLWNWPGSLCSTLPESKDCWEWPSGSRASRKHLSTLEGAEISQATHEQGRNQSGCNVGYLRTLGS